MKRTISTLLIFSLLIFLLTPLGAIKVNSGCMFYSSNTGQHVTFDASGEPWIFDSIRVTSDYLEIDNGADSERFIATVTGGECKFTIDVWDPDNTTQDATIASWTTDTSGYSTTTTFYTTSSDGYIWDKDTSYTTVHDSTSGTVDSTRVRVGQQYNTSSGYYYVMRAFVFFDTSTLPDNATITSAILSLYCGNDASDTDFDIVLQNGQPTYPHDPLQSADFLYSYYSGNGGSLNTSGIVNLAYNDLTLNSTGIGWISTTGTTKLCLKSSRDINNNTPTGFEDVSFETYENGSDYQPKLTVTYDPVSVSYEITGLEVSQDYQIWIDGAYDHDETTDASGVLTWTGHNLDASYSIDIKYGAGVILGVSTATETFAIGYLDKNTESTSHSCTIENTGNVTENIKIKFSTFTDASSNTWTVGDTADADQCVIKWSIDDTNWNTIASYDTYVTVKTNLAVNDTFTLYVRITAPTSSTSYDEYSSTMTIGCEQA